eukprot:TRINITY_DN1791_c0_g1_i1.p1 TRINITY_DN1791_c0_g1~~TRINITY_DN1791_c0_g1_i1.p1  ORF type:complete len:368 (+),score=106.63 TRINITY_DN1791_c0_g1_i1:567-1670(+)
MFRQIAATLGTPRYRETAQEAAPLIDEEFTEESPTSSLSSSQISATDIDVEARTPCEEKPVDDMSPPLLSASMFEIPKEITTAPIPLPEPATQKKFVFSVMVAGESGTGKTTFLNTFFPSNTVPKREVLLEPVTETIKVLSEVQMKTEKGAIFTVRPVDTPGYGDAPTAEYRISAIEAFQMEMMNKFDGTAPIAEDKRVHVCFYFITAHRLKEMDVKFMKRIAPLMNVIPVISKADCMTRDERRAFIQLIEERLKVENIPIFPLDEENHRLVFSIISSTSKGQNREYEWGTAEVNNRRHSDVLLLRELVIQQKYCEVFAETNKKTNQYRRTIAPIREFAIWRKKHQRLIRAIPVSFSISVSFFPSLR